jgi:hypothetical protein
MPFENLEEANAAFDELQERLSKSESENSKLKATKQGLIADLKKKKSVDSFLRVAGIELKPDAAEEEIAEQIAALRTPAPSGDEATPPPDPLQAASPDPSTPSQPGSPPTPADAMSAALQGKLASMEKQNESLAKLVQQITQERDEERAQRREARLERKILDELAKAECRRPSHLFKLERENFDLLDDGDTVMYRVGEELMPLRDAISKLKDDEEYSVYFNGSGATGSGLPPGRATSHVAMNNPFAVGSVNATQAAALFNDKPEQAKQLIGQARAAGKLDPTMAKVFASA